MHHRAKYINIGKVEMLNAMSHSHMVFTMHWVADYIMSGNKAKYPEFVFLNKALIDNESDSHRWIYGKNHLNEPKSIKEI